VALFRGRRAIFRVSGSGLVLRIICEKIRRTPAWGAVKRDYLIELAR
jgi:hypothetical protein